MPDIAVVSAATSAAPSDYTLAGQQEIFVRAVSAQFNGSSSTSSWLPALQLLSPSGIVMWTAVDRSNPVAAGGSANVSWFPGVRPGVSESTSPTGKLWAWYDFSDTSTLTIDGSGKVTAILDKSGLHHDLSQATAAQRPSQTTVNGLNAGLFNSAAQTVLIVGRIPDPLPQPYVIFGVWTQDLGAAANYFPGPLGGTGNPTPNPNWFENVDGLKIAMQQGANSIVTGFGSPFTQQTMSGVFNGASSSFRINGAAHAGTVDNDPVTTVALGAQQYPYLPGEVDGLDGKICEILYYYGPLTTSQIMGVEAYLKSKWNTP